MDGDWDWDREHGSAYCFSLTSPASITYTMSSIVMEVSARFVEITTCPETPPRGEAWYVEST